MEALRSITYGLYILTAKEGFFDNGCVINTLSQMTSDPLRISVTVNKQNYTHDMILNTGLFNVSILSQSAPFSLFQRFGFRSGRTENKVYDCPGISRSDNGPVYLADWTNAMLSGKVVQTVDLGSHTVFIAEVTESKVLSSQPSMSYSYYHANVKPKPEQKATEKKGWRCRICGYVHEEEELPADFVCPWCKHGPEDFERL